MVSSQKKAFLSYLESIYVAWWLLRAALKHRATHGRASELLSAAIEEINLPAFTSMMVVYAGELLI